MKVLLTKALYRIDIDYISSRLADGIKLIEPPGYTESEIKEAASDADVLLGGYLTEKIIRAAIRLKFIQVPWTGVENININLLKKYNITLCNSHSNAMAVAEHAVALMFDAAKKLSYHDRLLRNGEWNRVVPGNENKLSPFSNLISGSKIGIIGFGAVGTRIFNLLKGFNCKFYVFSKELPENPGNYSDSISFNSPDEILNKINVLNFIFIAVPLTPETNQMINKSFFSLVNKHAILINISRGNVIEEEALFNALINKDLAFAAIDTWFNYPTLERKVVFPSENYNFHLLDNIVLSPHRAGYITEGLPHLDDAIENLNRYFFGKPLLNVVSLDKQY